MKDNTNKKNQTQNQNTNKSKGRGAPDAQRERTTKPGENRPAQGDKYSRGKGNDKFAPRKENNRPRKDNNRPQKDNNSPQKNNFSSQKNSPPAKKENNSPQKGNFSSQKNHAPIQNDKPAFIANRQEREGFEGVGEPVEGSVIGRNAVRELLKSGRDIDKIFVRKGEREGSIVVIIAEARNLGIPVIEVEKAKLDSMSGGINHQGVVAMAAEKEYSSIEDILKIAEERGEVPLIVVADGITDPYNLGTLIRCAEGVGAHGLIIPKRRAAGLSPLVTKASAGAIEYLSIAKVPNIAAALDSLKEKGLWIYAADADGKAYYDTDFSGPCALVFGSEGEGISRIVLEKCDFIVSIPMHGKIESFNVSTAAAVLLSEASRRHRANKQLSSQ